MLETERYAEAVELLKFLLQCQGEDPRHYEEWQSLLDWLTDSFPMLQNEYAGEGEDFDPETEEKMARQHLEAKLAEDQNYAEKLLKAVMEKPLSEQTLLALDQLAYLDRPEVDDALIEWIHKKLLHPLLQYRVLQTLRRRGSSGLLSFIRGGEKVEIEIEAVPLKPEDFPYAVQAVLERVGNQTEIHDPTLFYFAQEMWSQFVMAIYGTMDYRSMLTDDDSVIDIWAASLHQTVAESLTGGGKPEEEIRFMYGITDDLRLRYEQACRSMRQFVTAGIRG
ncbi:hypothetical protein ACFQ3W_20675 [Paenibacillus puldeungensis]|uniref:Uncharacterized protein n=1 Tax=Paenibacillus puldeungensis TaxID=696536 RepID=A0ABW3S2L0_9BACL